MSLMGRHFIVRILRLKYVITIKHSFTSLLSVSQLDKLNMASITLKTCLTHSCVHVQKLKIIFNDDNQVLDLEPTVWRKIKQKRTEHPKWVACQKSQNHLLNSKNDKIIRIPILHKAQHAKMV